MVKWLGLCAVNEGGSGLTPDWGTRMVHVALYDQEKQKFKKIMPKK